MNNNLEFENEDPSPDSIEDNHPRTNYGEGYNVKETLEEAAENFWINDDSMSNNDRISYVNGFKQGAKWQQEQDNKELGMWKLAVEKQEARCKALNSIISTLQERSYSEKDMINFAFDTYCYISELMKVPFNQISENKLHAMYNFEQFKKK